MSVETGTIFSPGKRLFVHPELMFTVTFHLLHYYSESLQNTCFTYSVIKVKAPFHRQTEIYDTPNLFHHFNS